MQEAYMPPCVSKADLNILDTGLAVLCYSKTYKSQLYIICSDITDFTFSIFLESQQQK